MHRRLRCNLVGHLLLLAFAVATAASDIEAQVAAGTALVPGSEPLTLPNAILLALEHNPALAAVRAEAQALRADRDLARANRWPRLMTAAGWHRTDNQVAVFGDQLTAGEFSAGDFAIDSLNHPAAISHGSVSIVLDAPLYTSGRRRAVVDAADESSQAAQARLQSAAADLVAQVTEAYDGALLAAAAVEVARTAVESASGHERVAAARFENGAALKSDALRARVHLLGRERDLERKKADLEIARARLRMLLGSEPDESLALSDASPEAPAGPLGELQDWIGPAGAVSPDVESARRASRAAAAQVRAERSALGPEIAGTARYERNANGFDSGDGTFFVGVDIQWSALDRGRAPRIEAARALASAALARSRETENRARLAIEQAYRDAEVADRNVGRAESAVMAADEARRICADRYSAGMLPLTDLLDSETALMQARLAEIQARFESATGRVRLELAAGRIVIPPVNAGKR